jgi:hypothetical protein
MAHPVLYRMSPFWDSEVQFTSQARTMAAPVRSKTRSEFCQASKEDLLALKKNPLDVSDDCPICRDDSGILCRVGCHPSAATGKCSLDIMFSLFTSI